MAKRLLAIHIDGTIDYNEPIEVGVAFKNKLAELKRQGYAPVGIILSNERGGMTTAFGDGRTVISNVVSGKSATKLDIAIPTAAWYTEDVEVNF